MRHVGTSIEREGLAFLRLCRALYANGGARLTKSPNAYNNKSSRFDLRSAYGHAYRSVRVRMLSATSRLTVRFPTATDFPERSFVLG